MSPDAERDAFDHGLEQLLSVAIRRIVKDENPESFQRWVREALPVFLPRIHRECDAASSRALAGALARAIWNATPLPGNRFRPDPIAAPGPEAPCPCGSGQPYGECCRVAEPELPIDQTIIWPFLLGELPRKTLKSAIGLGLVPSGMIAAWCRDQVQAGDAAKAVPLLEPLFEGELGDDPDLADALDVLLDAYQALGRPRKKQALLRHIIDSAPRSALRSSAWQRLATMRMDAGEVRAAWDAFAAAQRDDPDSPHLATLEVLLLVESGDERRARERAQYWSRRLRRHGYGDDEGPLEFLDAIVERPAAAFVEVQIAASRGTGGGLREWLAGVAERKVPVYRLEAPGAATVDDADARTLDTLLDALGLEKVPAHLEALIVELERELEAGGSLEIDPVAGERVLVPPAEVVRVDAEWRTAFPFPKPLSTAEDLPTGIDPWRVEDVWTAFLRDHPESFDSLDVLDDLATALRRHPGFGAGAWDEIMVAPILERARRIVDRALGARTSTRLPWTHRENRPPLRALARLVHLNLRRNANRAAAAIAERLIALNPVDQHGVRTVLMNHYLGEADDQRALALAAAYGDDSEVEIAFGRVLALYRSGRRAEAEEALGTACYSHPKVARSLTAKRMRAPRIDNPELGLNAEETAWLYRMEMRPVWEATPGALEWLRALTSAPRARRRGA